MQVLEKTSLSCDSTTSIITHTHSYQPKLHTDTVKVGGEPSRSLFNTQAIFSCKRGSRLRRYADYHKLSIFYVTRLVLR